ncbi:MULTISPECIES: hypothetical protein [unclassified Streptomyces]|uniref:hypothetical protein n=1 Tax=unclassified Streptomyces TaxID=2593676 RepID=UPI00225BA6B6|nr:MULTISPECIES: hypothetical protein [unclassified Streptomyces]MCX4524160.1 hypothetical protein [Streptomyces sp. NBC_01551]MCX4545321.1 hypothetical protein [Streptomyces sp. NBC_01565]
MDGQDRDNPADEVVVAVGDCSPEDAHAVLDLLERSFSPESGVSGAAQGGQAATVWSATFDAARPAEPPERQPSPVRLKDAVSVTLQGGPRAVERVRAALAGHFTVEGTGTVSGDQEKEIGLRVRS